MEQPRAKQTATAIESMRLRIATTPLCFWASLEQNQSRLILLSLVQGHVDLNAAVSECINSDTTKERSRKAFQSAHRVCAEVEKTSGRLTPPAAVHNMPQRL
jgi:hypothetical protein